MGRRNRHRNRRDRYGIYEIPEYRPVKRKKKKKPFTLKTFGKWVGLVVILLILVYGVSFGIKYSMRNKALSLYEKEDYTAAVDLFKEALKPGLPLLESFDNDVRFYLADCYVNMGEYGLACHEYSKIRVIWQMWHTGYSYMNGRITDRHFQSCCRHTRMDIVIWYYMSAVVTDRPEIWRICRSIMMYFYRRMP